MSPARHEVIVVGGGVYGASIAFWLSRRGVAVTLLERAHLASGPTGRSSANVRLHYTTPELAELARIGLEIMGRFTELTGGGDAGFMRVGMLYGLGEEDAPIFEANARRLRALGYPIELLDPGRMTTLLPGFDLDGIVLGVLEPTTGYADPVGTTTGFADGAVRLGATLLMKRAVSRILAEGGRVQGVELASGERILAPRVILAAGPWSRGLAATVGADLPLLPERHAITILAAPEGARNVVPCVWSDKPNRYYARPEGDGSVILGGWTSGTVPVKDPDDFDETVPLTESAEHVARASRRIPAVASLGIRPGYASLYDVTPDRFPIVGEIPSVHGLWICAGTSGHGFKLAPGIGQEFVRLVLDGEADLLRPLRLDRSFGSVVELSA